MRCKCNSIITEDFLLELDDPMCENCYMVYMADTQEPEVDSEDLGEDE